VFVSGADTALLVASGFIVLVAVVVAVAFRRPRQPEPEPVLA